MVVQKKLDNPVINVKGESVNGLLKLGAMRARVLLVIVMLIIAIVVIFLLESSALDEETKKILLDYGTNYYPITIQNIMWIFFFLGIGELIYRVAVALGYSKDLAGSYLPEDETTMLTTKDTRELYKKINKNIQMIDDMPSLIKRLILYFQSNKSISQTHDMLNSQIDIKYNQMETQYSMIRYIAWVIPTFGFIGTVIGISMSLSYAGGHDPQASDFLQEITTRLGVAFYTTLIALCMSTILVFMMHVIQSFEEQILMRLEEYILDNFINRLYV